MQAPRRVSSPVSALEMRFSAAKSRLAPSCTPLVQLRIREGSTLSSSPRFFGSLMAKPCQLAPKGSDKLWTGSKLSLLPVFAEIFQISGRKKRPPSAVHAAGHDWKIERTQLAPKGLDKLLNGDASSPRIQSSPVSALEMGLFAANIVSLHRTRRWYN